MPTQFENKSRTHAVDLMDIKAGHDAPGITSGTGQDQTEAGSQAAPWIDSRYGNSVIRFHDPKGIVEAAKRGKTTIFSATNKDAGIFNLENAKISVIDTPDPAGKTRGLGLDAMIRFIPHSHRAPVQREYDSDYDPEYVADQDRDFFVHPLDEEHGYYRLLHRSGQEYIGHMDMVNHILRVSNHSNLGIDQYRKSKNLHNNINPHPISSDVLFDDEQLKIFGQLTVRSLFSSTLGTAKGWDLSSNPYNQTPRTFHAQVQQESVQPVEVIHAVDPQEVFIRDGRDNIGINTLPGVHRRDSMLARLDSTQKMTDKLGSIKDYLKSAWGKPAQVYGINHDTKTDIVSHTGKEEKQQLHPDNLQAEKNKALEKRGRQLAAEIESEVFAKEPVAAQRVSGNKQPELKILHADPDADKTDSPEVQFRSSGFIPDSTPITLDNHGHIRSQQAVADRQKSNITVSRTIKPSSNETHSRSATTVRQDNKSSDFDPYAVLGLPHDASSDKVEQAYKEKAVSLIESPEPENVKVQRFASYHKALNTLTASGAGKDIDRGSDNAGAAKTPPEKTPESEWRISPNSKKLMPGDQGRDSQRVQHSSTYEIDPRTGGIRSVVQKANKAKSSVGHV